MENDVIIKVEGLYKKFALSLKRSLLYGSTDVFKSMLGMRVDSGKLRKSEFWSLKDINFELRKGETLGIIGVNGSGKSTLLRILTGIFPPDKGTVTVKGQIGSLIAVGAGFHPHMTGRENIYLNGIILGMTREEIDKKFNEIIEFADIGEFLDAPVSTYSSGMRVRLGFSIAVQSEPDILLVDEVLSVGDLSFRNKSLRKMNELRNRAKGIIFVSHNLEQIRSLCTKVIVIDKGSIIFNGDTQQGCVLYEEMARVKSHSDIKSKPFANARNHEYSSEEIDILELGILDENGNKISEVSLNEGIKVYCDIEVKKPLESLYFSLGIVDNSDYKNVIHLVSNDNKTFEPKNLKKNKYRITIEIKNHNLMPNIYLINFAIRNGATTETYQRIFSDVSFRVVSDKSTLSRGIVNVESNWGINTLK